MAVQATSKQLATALIAIAIILTTLTYGALAVGGQTPTPSPTFSVTYIPYATSMASSTPIAPNQTTIPSPFPTPELTPEVSVTPSPTITSTPTAEPTTYPPSTPTPTLIPAASTIPDPIPDPTATPIPPTAAPSPSDSPTPLPTPSLTPTPDLTPTPTPTSTPAPTSLPPPTPTPTPTTAPAPTPTPTPTPSPSGTITSGTPNIGIYSNPECTQILTSIAWGSVAAGSQATKTIYIKNTGTAPMTLSMTVSGWNPTTAGAYITISWNRQGTTVPADQSVAATLTITVAANINGVTNFSNTITISGTG